MVGLDSKKLEHILKFLIGLMALIWMNIVASDHFFRLDLTEEKRYSIKGATKELLRNLDDQVYIEVYLEGKLNAPFERLQRSIKEILEEFQVYSDDKIIFEFFDPAQASGQKARNEFMMSLINKGITPTNIIEENEGNRTEHIIFPGAVVSYGGQEEGVMLLKGRRGEAAINQSIGSLEYEFASVIKKLSDPENKRIGLVNGHGELDSLEIIAFRSALQEKYLVEDVFLEASDLSLFNALVIAKPKEKFTENEKFQLDQYILKGGKVLFMIDQLDARMDSASSEHNIAFPLDVNLQDMLFQYGIRINNDLVQDNQAIQTPVVIGYVGEEPQMRMMPWPFFPLVTNYQDHPVSKNLDASLMRFASSIDTVKAVGVRKTPLMVTSGYTRVVKAPVKVSINDLRENMRPEEFNRQNVPLAYLLEGNFTSVFKNRFLPEGEDKKDFVDHGGSKIIIISDGDFAKNGIDPSTGQILEVGYDPYTKRKYANEDFIMNSIAYLVEEDGIIQARNKEIVVRPLDKIRINESKIIWQVVNLIFPLVILIIGGLIIYFYRRRKYTNF